VHHALVASTVSTFEATSPAIALASRITAKLWFADPSLWAETVRTLLVSSARWTPAILILDNLGSHKGENVRQAIRSAGAKLFFLPEYSSDLNPIEQVFAKLKHLLRTVAARTLETVVAAIGEFAQRLHCQRMRQLVQKRRIWTNLNASRSSQSATDMVNLIIEDEISLRPCTTRSSSPGCRGPRMPCGV
jgi:transposase